MIPRLEKQLQAAQRRCDNLQAQVNKKVLRITNRSTRVAVSRMCRFDAVFAVSGVRCISGAFGPWEQQGQRGRKNGRGVQQHQGSRTAAQTV